MSQTVAVELRVDPVTQARAEGVLQREGLSISEALDILLTRTADQGAFPLDRTSDVEYDAWVRTQVQAALDDDSPSIPHEIVTAHFERRKADLLRRLEE